ncbi:MAG: CPBP family intramembrane metalloprotease, partial [Myxococcota bacterium]|nr:CPBP family intramembrane metalloprotease [Myxococcota bacterium]
AEPAFTGSPAEFVLATAIGTFGLFNVVVLLCRLGRVSWRDLGWTTSRLGTELLWGVLGFTACAAAIMATTTALGGRDALREFVTAVGAYSPASRLLFLAIGLSAAAYEESIFRGYLQPALSARWGNAVAILVTAAIFSLYHLQLNPVGLLVKLCFGMVFGTLRWRRGSLVAPAAAHVLVWVILGAA